MSVDVSLNDREHSVVVEAFRARITGVLYDTTARRIELAKEYERLHSPTYCVDLDDLRRQLSEAEAENDAVQADIAVIREQVETQWQDTLANSGRTRKSRQR